MTEDVNDLIQAYSEASAYQYVQEDATVQATQENGICGDSITVFLKIDASGSIREYSFGGYPQVFTKAAAAMLGEQIAECTTETVLTWDYEFMHALGLTVSPRRRRSVVSALLATRNAIHQRKKDGQTDTYDDLLPL